MFPPSRRRLSRIAWVAILVLNSRGTAFADSPANSPADSSADWPAEVILRFTHQPDRRYVMASDPPSPPVANPPVSEPAAPFPARLPARAYSLPLKSEAIRQLQPEWVVRLRQRAENWRDWQPPADWPVIDLPDDADWQAHAPKPRTVIRLRRGQTYLTSSRWLPGPVLLGAYGDPADPPPLLQYATPEMPAGTLLYPAGQGPIVIQDLRFDAPEARCIAAAATRDLLVRRCEYQRAGAFITTHGEKPSRGIFILDNRQLIPQGLAGHFAWLGDSSWTESAGYDPDRANADWWIQSNTAGPSTREDPIRGSAQRVAIVNNRLEAGKKTAMRLSGPLTDLWVEGNDLSAVHPASAILAGLVIPSHTPAQLKTARVSRVFIIGNHIDGGLELGRGLCDALITGNVLAGDSIQSCAVSIHANAPVPIERVLLKDNRYGSPVLLRNADPGVIEEGNHRLEN